ncbi:uncharacterized protein CXorf49-like [Echinops telfairi]|uniref:Uncharacterized protein CXorf49-like n=1 Tax=Echinops telfairi TaxID=9371 RepID=A0AC55D346_ECHTE|nr:uncharacterized protein CXorf49-like [Echinops telfairi]
MSSPDEVSGLGAGLNSEGGEQGGVQQDSPGGQQGLGLGHEQGAPLNNEGEGGVPARGDLEVKKEVVKATGTFLWSQEDRPGSQKIRNEDNLDHGSCYQEPEDFAAILQHLLHLDEQSGFRSKSSTESCDTHESTSWEDPDKEPTDRSTTVPSNSSAESQRTSHALSVPEGGQAWGTPRRGPKRSLSTTMDLPRPSIEIKAGPSSSVAYRKRQQMRMSICSKAAGWPENLKDPSRHPTPHVQKNIFHTASSFVATTPRRFSSASERQPVEELDCSSMKKTQSRTVWSLRQPRPTYSGPTAGGALPRVTSTRKGGHQKVCPSDASRITMLRKPPSLPSWGQRFSRGPPEPATLPPIFGIPLLLPPRP